MKNFFRFFFFDETHFECERISWQFVDNYIFTNISHYVRYLRSMQMDKRELESKENLVYLFLSKPKKQKETQRQ